MVSRESVKERGKDVKRSVFVTGAHDGTGFAIASRFAKEGYAVFVGSRSIEKIKSAAAGREAYAVCNLGMENMWLGKLEEGGELPPSYFTTMIIK